MCKTLAACRPAPTITQRLPCVHALPQYLGVTQLSRLAVTTKYILPRAAELPHDALATVVLPVLKQLAASPQARLLLACLHVCLRHFDCRRAGRHSAFGTLGQESIEPAFRSRSTGKEPYKRRHHRALSGSCSCIRCLYCHPQNVPGAVKDGLRSTACVPSSAGGRCRPGQLYDPRSQELRCLLGPAGPFPAGAQKRALQ